MKRSSNTSYELSKPAKIVLASGVGALLFLSGIEKASTLRLTDEHTKELELPECKVDQPPVIVAREGDTIWDMADEITDDSEDIRKNVHRIAEFNGGSSIAVGQTVQVCVADDLKTAVVNKK